MGNERDGNDLLSNEEKREEMLGYYIRRNAVIHDKYSDMRNAPETIRREAEALRNMISALKNSRKRIQWQEIETSDGLAIDSFQKKVYEEALEKFNNFHEKNDIYITKEEEEKFEFFNLNFEAIRDEMRRLKTAEARNSFIERYKYNPNKASLEMQDEIDNILNEAAKLDLPTIEELDGKNNEELEIEAKEELDGKNNEELEIEAKEELGGKDNEEERKEQDTNLPVQESKFAEIYQGVRGKLKGLFKKLKDRFFGRGQNDKNTEEENKEQNNHDEI